MSPPYASVLLLTRNGAETLPGVLAALGRQRAAFPFEVTAVDSSSTDGTRELLAEREVRVTTIDARDFDHGATRNLGVEGCLGEFVALLVQDAEPADESWLENLVTPFAADDRVAGTYARQLVRPEAGAITRYYLRDWAASRVRAQARQIPSRAAFDAWHPMARYEACIFDDVSSCVRRAVWREHPFPATPFAEDVAWAKRVLLAGWRIAYAPQARVWHSHERDVRHEFARTRIAHAQLASLFDLRTVPTRRQLVRAIAASLWIHLRCVARGPRGPRSAPAEVARALGLAVAYPLGQYLGARRARYGG